MNELYVCLCRERVRGGERETLCKLLSLKWRNRGGRRAAKARPAMRMRNSLRLLLGLLSLTLNPAAACCCTCCLLVKNIVNGLTIYLRSPTDGNYHPNKFRSDDAETTKLKEGWERKKEWEECLSDRRATAPKPRKSGLRTILHLVTARSHDDYIHETWVPVSSELKDTGEQPSEQIPFKQGRTHALVEIRVLDWSGSALLAEKYLP